MNQKVKQRITRALTKEEQQMIVDYCDNNGMEEDSLFFILKCNSSLLVHDIAKLRVRDVIKSNGEAKDSIYYFYCGYRKMLNDECRKAILEFVSGKDLSEESYLFNFGIERRAMRHIKEITDKLGINTSVIAHTLTLTYRATIADKILDSANGIEKLKALFCESCSCRKLEQLAYNLEV